MQIFDPSISGSTNISGSTVIVGDLTISGSILSTTNFTGTASFAQTASYALNAGASFPYTGSAEITGSLGITGSLSVTGSQVYLTTDDFVVGVNGVNRLTVDPSATQLTDETGTGGIDLSSTSRQLLDNLAGSSVDWNNRYLIKSDGTTIAFDWENGILVVQSGSSTPVLTVDPGNGVNIYDVFGVISGDFQLRLLKDSLASQSINWENRALVDPTGVESLFWASRRLMDSNASASIFWSNRSLYKSDETVVFDWENGILTSSLYGTSSWAENAQTASYVNPLNQDVEITGSLFVSNSINSQLKQLINNSGVGTVAWATSALIDNNTSSSVLWNQRRLEDENKQQSVNWNSRYLQDNAAKTSVDWHNRRGIDSHTSTSLDWGSRRLQDSQNKLSVHWENRKLYKSDGLTVAFDWENGILTSSLHGTASWAQNAISSSYSSTSSYSVNAELLDNKDSSVFATTGSNLFTQTQIISGALQLNPTEDPGGANTTSSFFFVTSSGDNTEFNLHYRNNGALWEQHWLEERVDTGLVWGGVVTFTGTTMSITPGAGLIVNHNANTSSHGDTIPTYVQFGPITASATFITSSQVTYLLIDTDGSLIQQTNIFTPQQFNEKLPLGYIFCLTTSSISSYADARTTTYGQDEQQTQFIRAFGPLKVSGYDITPQSGSLKISIASGRSYRFGGFYIQNPDNPSLYDSSAVATGSLVRVYRDPSAVGGFRAALSSSGFPYTDIDPTMWDDGSGTLQAVGANEWTIQRVFQGVVNGISYVYYGQSTYDSLNAAIQSITTEPFEESQTSILALPFIGYIIARGNTADLADTTNNKLINSGLFRNTAGSSGGGGVATTNLNDLADVNITSPSTGQALVYNAGLWENNTPLNSTSASYATTASYAQTASYVVVFPYTGSAIISGSLKVTGSLTATDDQSKLSFDSNRVLYYDNGVTALDWSLASLYDGTGVISANYNGRELNDASGFLSVDWSGRVLHDNNEAVVFNWNTRQFVQSITVSQSLLVTGSATVTGSLRVSQGVTASLFGTSSWANNATTASFALEGDGVFSGSFSGSYRGDGSQLTGVVASSAPAGPDKSIQFNDAGSTSGSGNFTFHKTTNIVSVTGSIIATSFTGSLQGSASYALTASFSPENPATSGVGSNPTTTSTQTITHGLGRTPIKIRIFGISQFTNNASGVPVPFSIGTWTSSGNRCVYQPYDPAAITNVEPSATSTTFAVRIDTAANVFTQGVIQNVGATTFDIAWTATGTPAARSYLWEAE